MKATHEQHNDFFAHKSLPGVIFEHNDSVDVIGGEHAGNPGVLISVEELGDDPVFLVELSSGKDALVRQSCLRRLA